MSKEQENQMLKEFLMSHRVTFRAPQDESSLKIGRNDLGIEYEMVVDKFREGSFSSEHFTLDFTNQGVLLRPLSDKKAKIHYNGKAIGPQGVMLESGIQIRVGLVLFEVRVSPDKKSCTFENFVMFQRSTVEIVQSKNFTIPLQGTLLVGSEQLANRGLSSRGVSKNYFLLTSYFDSTIDHQTVTLVPGQDEQVKVTRRGVTRFVGFSKDPQVNYPPMLDLDENDVITVGQHTFKFALEEGGLIYQSTQAE
jgi:hypothetical protein